VLLVKPSIAQLNRPVTSNLMPFTKIMHAIEG